MAGITRAEAIALWLTRINNATPLISDLLRIVAEYLISHEFADPTGVSTTCVFPVPSDDNGVMWSSRPSWCTLSDISYDAERLYDFTVQVSYNAGCAHHRFPFMVGIGTKSLDILPPQFAYRDQPITNSMPTHAIGVFADLDFGMLHTRRSNSWVSSCQRMT